MFFSVMHRISYLLIAVLLLVTLPLDRGLALEHTPQLKNINTTTIDMFEMGDPRNGLDLVGNGTHAFFTNKDLANGNELWVSDGTPTGTELLYDSNPGSASASITSLRMIGSKLFFYSNGLWVSDGSSLGTYPIVITDTNSIYPRMLNLLIAPSPVAGKALLYDSFSSGPLNLWLSDGTSAGTTELKTIPLHPPSSASPEFFSSFTVGSTTYFSISYGSSDAELWKTDGTTDGTLKITNFDSGINQWAAIGNTLYFLAIRDAAFGLWKSDGSAAGTQLVRSVNALGELTAVGTMLYFQGTDGAATPKVALWKSDGTSAGTGIVQSFNSFSAVFNSEVRHLTNVAGKLYFAGEAGIPSILDGNTVVQLAPSIVTASFDFKPAFTDFGGTTYFFALTNARSELWKSDGTPAGTVRVTEMAATTSYMSGAMVVLGDRLTLTFGQLSSPGIATFWVSDGTSDGTTKLLPRSYEAGISFRDRNPIPQFTQVNQALFFAADDGINGNELWVSDGSAANTHLVKDIYPGGFSIFINGSGPHLLFSYQNKLYFLASDSSGTSLWQSDGTDAGTVVVKTLDGYWSGTSILEHDGILYFTVVQKYQGRQVIAGALWRSDGTTAGTQVVATSGNASNLIVSNNLLYFIGLTAGKTQLLASNGSPGNVTALLESQPSGYSISQVFALTDLNGVLYFLYYDGQSTTSLRKTSGTPASTTLVKTIANNAVALLTDMAALQNKLYFRFGNSDTASLWVSDGTEAGTGVLREFVPGQPFLNDLNTVSRIVVVNNRLLFRANDGIHGDELWVSDGSAAGTHMLNDMNAGFLGSNITNMRVVGGKLYFAATNGVSGMELWVSSAYEGSTIQVSDIDAGPGSSNPLGMALFDNQIFFVANDGSTGAEVWSAPIIKNFTAFLPAVGGP